MRGVDAIAQILKLEGVEYLFSYPNHPLIDAAAKIGIRPIIARSEKTLINMADGYTPRDQRPPARRRRRPGRAGHRERLRRRRAGVRRLRCRSWSSRAARTSARAGAGRVRSAARSTATSRSGSAAINFAGAHPELMRRAFTQLRNGQPGPVLLELPGDVGGAEIDEAAFALHAAARATARPATRRTWPRRRGCCSAPSRPVLHAGHGVLWAEAWDELRELAELIQTPVHDHDGRQERLPRGSSAGARRGRPHAGARPPRQFLVSADLVFGIGCSFASGSFSAPIPAGKTHGPDRRSSRRDLDKDYPVDLAIVGDAKLVLRQLIDEVKRQAGANGRRARR